VVSGCEIANTNLCKVSTNDLELFAILVGNSQGRRDSEKQNALKEEEWKEAKLKINNE